MMSLLSLWSVGASAVGVLAAIRLVRYMMFELVSVRGQHMGPFQRGSGAGGSAVQLAVSSKWPSSSN